MRVKVAPDAAHLLAAEKPAGTNSGLARLWQEARREREAEERIAPRPRPETESQSMPKRVRFNYD